MDDAVYESFDTLAGFQAAIDRLLAAAGRELRIFDPDGSALRLNDAARVGALEGFLRASRTRRLYMVVHEPQHLQRDCPRMMALLGRYGHAIQVHRTQEEIRDLQDAFLVLDSVHYVRRPVAAVPRGAIGLHDQAEALAMRARFNEIWTASYPAVSATTIGL
jgi:hypothetical protein